MLYEARQEMQTLEARERTVREQVSSEVAPEVGGFLASKVPQPCRDDRGGSKAVSGR